MSERDAFEDEMLFRSLSDQDVENLLRGRAPEAGQFAEVAEFAQAVRQDLSRPAADDPMLVSRLAETARVAREAQTAVAPTAVRPSRRRLMPARLALAAKAVGVIAVVPLLFAGLAVADVTLPEPAREAFEAVGVSLPNQPATGGQATEPGGEASDQPDRVGDGDTPTGENARQEKGGTTAAEKRQHGTAKENPARAGGRANGEQGQGRALGKRGLAPGQVQPPGQLRAPGRQRNGQREAAEKPAPPARGSNPSGEPPEVTPFQGSSGGGEKASKGPGGQAGPG